MILCEVHLHIGGDIYLTLETTVYVEPARVVYDSLSQILLDTTSCLHRLLKEKKTKKKKKTAIPKTWPWTIHHT